MWGSTALPPRPCITTPVTSAYRNTSHPLILLNYRQVRIKLLFFFLFPKKVEAGNKMIQMTAISYGFSASVEQYQLVSLGSWGPRGLALCRPSLFLQFTYWLVSPVRPQNDIAWVPSCYSRRPPSHLPSHFPHALSLLFPLHSCLSLTGYPQQPS